MFGLDIATLQSPSRQRTKRIAESAEPCVVPREIGNELLNPLLTITAPFKFVRMCIIKLISRLGVSILLRKQRMYWKDTLSKAFRKSSFTLRIGRVISGYCLHHHFRNNSSDVFTPSSIDISELMWFD